MCTANHQPESQFLWSTYDPELFFNEKLMELLGQLVHLIHSH